MRPPLTHPGPRAEVCSRAPPHTDDVFQPRRMTHSNTLRFSVPSSGPLAAGDIVRQAQPPSPSLSRGQSPRKVLAQHVEVRLEPAYQERWITLPISPATSSRWTQVPSNKGKVKLWARLGRLVQLPPLWLPPAPTYLRAHKDDGNGEPKPRASLVSPHCVDCVHTQRLRYYGESVPLASIVLDGEMVCWYSESGSILPHSTHGGTKTTA